MPHYYDPTPDRSQEYGNGVSTEYRGFTITDTFDVVKGGKLVWRCGSVQAAMNRIDTSIAMKKLQDKGAALRQFTGSCELENGEERREREADQVNHYYENENYKHESGN